MNIEEVLNITIIGMFGFILLSPVIIVMYEYIKDKGWRVDNNEY